MIKKLYPVPSYDGVDDLGDDIYSCILCWYDEELEGFPVDQEPGEPVFSGSLDECIDYLELNKGLVLA